MKILAIGNSFSVDSMEWLYNIADSVGTRFELGNLYIGGCSLETHWKNADSGVAEYVYYKNTSGEWLRREGTTLIQGLKDEDWDIITMQQASGFSGMPESYSPYLENLIDYVNENKTNPSSKLFWNMTWAYQQDSDHSRFENYGYDQMTMYNAIVETVKNKIVTNPAFAGVIPTGVAIQNVRKSKIGDKLTRDGYHLSFNLGRYIAAMTWYHKLTELLTNDITYVPDKTEIPGEYLKIIKSSVMESISSLGCVD